MEFIKELENDNSFSLFTKLIQRKISGATISNEYLTKDEIKIMENISYAIKKITFDCPCCHNPKLADVNQSVFNCDCGASVNIGEQETEPRYFLSEESYQYFKGEAAQSLNINNKDIKCVFGEKEIDTSQHDTTISLHITPFQNESLISEFSCLDKAYLDHYLINWDSLLSFIKQKEEMVTSILKYRNDRIINQIDWKRIDYKDFQDLVYEIIDDEKMFSKLVPGGTGADQGKDLFGYTFTARPVGKPEEVNTLIQCKYTERNASFNSDDILKYVTKAKRHNCNYLLFVTNGNLTGDTVTEIHSQPYTDKTFRDVDFWDNHKLLLLLEKHPNIRLKYFYIEKS